MNVLTYGEWRDTCDTVHMLLQMMGKAKLQSMDPQPEWKQVVLDADANGFTTGLIPFGADGFEIKLNIADAEMAAMTAAGDCARFPIEECVSVSELSGRFTAMLENIGHPIAINTVPQEMHTEVPFDRQNIAREFDAAAARRCSTPSAGPSTTSETSTNTPAARTCRSGRCSSSQRTDWRTPAGAMTMRRCGG